MTREALDKLMESKELTDGEKIYIKDCQFHLGGSFSNALFEAIARADNENLNKLASGFPQEVQGFLAWARGNLHARASKIAGCDL